MLGSLLLVHAFSSPSHKLTTLITTIPSTTGASKHTDNIHSFRLMRSPHFPHQARPSSHVPQTHVHACAATYQSRVHQQGDTPPARASLGRVRKTHVAWFAHQQRAFRSCDWVSCFTLTLHQNGLHRSLMPPLINPLHCTQQHPYHRLISHHDDCAPLSSTTDKRMSARRDDRPGISKC